jgi:hypothetical protein
MKRQKDKWHYKVVTIILCTIIVIGIIYAITYVLNNAKFKCDIGIMGEIIQTRKRKSIRCTKFTHNGTNVLLVKIL